MKSLPAIVRVAAVSAAVLAMLAASCGGSSSFDSDPDAVRSAGEMLKKLNAGNKLTADEFRSAGSIFEKYPDEAVPSELYRKALLQREDWASLEQLLTSGKGPATRDDRILLGKVYIKLGDYEKAKEAFLAVEPPLNAEQSSFLATAYFHTGENDKAEAILDSIRQELVGEKIVEGLVLRGLLHFYKGENEKAISVLESVIEIDPKSVPAHNALSRIYGKIGDKEKASEHVRAVEEAYKSLTDSTTERVRMVDQLMSLQEAFKAGRHEEVIRLGNKLVDTATPANKLAIYQYLHRSNLALGRNAEAEEALEKARQMSSQ